MSGPKGGSYVVVSAEELERRALRAAHERYDRVRVQYAEVCRSIAAFGSAPAEALHDVAGSSDVVNAAARVAESRLESARERLTDLRVAEALRATPRLRLSLAPPAPSDVVLPRPAVERDSPGQPGGALEKAETTVAAALRELGETAVPALAGLLDSVRAAEGSAQASLALAHLRGEVQKMRALVKQKNADDRAREMVLAVLDGCTSQEARIAKQRVAAATSGPPAVSVDYARSLAQREKAELDAAYVEDSVLDVLEELGYEVGESVTVSVARSGVLVEVPGYPRHLARFHRAGDQLRFNVVRVGTGDPGQDAAAETVACGIFEQVQQELAEQGVHWTLSRREAPGAVPLDRAEGLPPVIAWKRTGKTRPAHKWRTRQRARERGL